MKSHQPILPKEIRNQIAHVIGVYDVSKRVFKITYKQGDSEKEIILDKEFIQSFQHECYTLEKELEEILNLLNI